MFSFKFVRGGVSFFFVWSCCCHCYSLQFGVTVIVAAVVVVIALVVGRWCC